MGTLSVNVDMVAALREAAALTEPDPAQAAVLAELAGADGVAVQLRRSRRLIRDRDLYLLKGVVKSKLTVEVPPDEGIIQKAMEVKPWMVTFGDDQGNADAPISAIDLGATDVDFTDVVARFRGVGVHAAFFIEPEAAQVKAAAKAGASMVMLNCARYGGAATIEDAQQELVRLDAAGNAAIKADLAVYLGHGIQYRNVRPLVDLNIADEFVVGRAVTVRALIVGFERAVKEMLTIVQAGPDQN